MKKWTKAEREAASIAGKKRWAARKKQDVRSTDVAMERIGGADYGDVIRAALLLHANGHLADRQVVDILDRVFTND